MTTSIDVEDVRNNPQDYLVDGEEEVADAISYAAYWGSKNIKPWVVRISDSVKQGRITRKPKHWHSPRPTT